MFFKSQNVCYAPVFILLFFSFLPLFENKPVFVRNNESAYELIKCGEISVFLPENIAEAGTRIPALIGIPLLALLLLFMFISFLKNRSESRRLVQQLTAELNKSRQDLQNALDIAKTANNSKSVFLANMSHEIRTPMNSIVGFSELAMDGEVSPKTRDYLAKIIDNAEWLLQIINDIIDFSKIELGEMEIEHIPFDMHELFASCRTLIMPKAIEKGVMLHFYAEPSVGQRPLGDPARLRQILVNLLSNSVKFTNTGMIKLHSAVKEKTDKTLSMHFEVKDSGIGMTSGQIERIFDPFMRVETGTTRTYGGTGLGLAITKNIVELMGGKLIVSSTVGVGSMFSFDLTFETIDIAEDEMPSKKIIFNEIEKPFFEGEILLCEDNVMNQQVICEHLARVGLKTIVADNGKIGVEMVQRRKEKGDKQFDLIFMDMHMPVMDGLEASAKILELNTGVPVVAMTANIMSNDLVIYRMNGMSDCVGKPFTSQELWRCLLKYLKPVSGGGSAIAKPPAGDAPADDMSGFDVEFKRKIKKIFIKSNQDKFKEIITALDNSDIKVAHRLVHTLNGNAAQLGLVNLQKTAADVENQLKDGKNLVTSEQLALLEKELGTTLSKFAAEVASFNEEPETVQVQTLDAQAARELLEKLELMLKMGNPDCRSFTNSLRGIAGSERLIRHIEDFEFDQALALLDDLRKKLD
jgi:signal transduction histidine kinase/CheY-like chemotaxis protein